MLKKKTLEEKKTKFKLLTSQNRRRRRLGLSFSNGIEEIPYKNSIIMRAANNLELVKLQPEHTPCMLLKNKIFI